MESKNLKCEKKAAMRAAKELCYGDAVVQKINNAKTVYEINRILYTARIAK